MENKIRILAWPAFDYEPFNPYNWLLNKNLEEKGVKIIPYNFKNLIIRSYDIWHMHWPAENVFKESFSITLFRLFGFFLLLIVVKLKGAKIVWTAHNPRLHDTRFPVIENLFWSLFPHFVDAFICHSKYALSIIQNNHPALVNTKNYVIHHGHYKNWYTNALSKSEARETLKLPEEDFVLLFSGSIRPYKNVKLLVNVFSERNYKNEKLIIAGKPSSEEIFHCISRSAQRNKNVLFKARWIEDDEFQIFFNAADVVVLPYNIMNSGMALLALSFGCPVLMPENPMLLEYKDIVGRDLIHLYANELNNKVFDEVKEKIRSNSLNSQNKSLAELDWNNIALKTKSVYKQLISNG